jgi:hypothetical protein
MSRVGFEATTPVFEVSKIVHVLDSVATVIGVPYYMCNQIYSYVMEWVKGKNNFVLTGKHKS